MNEEMIPTAHLATVNRLFKGGDKLRPQLDDNDVSLLHAVIGIVGEAGELEEAVLAMRQIGGDAFSGRSKAKVPDPTVDGLGGGGLVEIHKPCPETQVTFWSGPTDDLPGINFENLKEELGDHLFYEAALRVAAGLEELPDIGPSVGLWNHPHGPLTRARDDDYSAKQVLCDLIDCHSVVTSRMLDTVKRWVMYRKPKDDEKLRQKFIQALVDDCWVIQQIAMLLGVSEEELRRGNIEKLETGTKDKPARYGTEYTDEAAIQRADKAEDETSDDNPDAEEN